MEEGRKIIAFSSTEAGVGGSDCFNPKTQIRAGKDGYILNGKKWHITNAPHADVFIVWCKLEGALVAVMVDGSAKGLSVGKQSSPSGARTSPVAEVEFNNVFVPKEQLISLRRGSRYLNEIFIAERLVCAVITVGIGEICIDKVLTFGSQRRFGGKPLNNIDTFRTVVAEMQIKLDAATGQAKHCMDMFLDGTLVDGSASSAKINCVEQMRKLIQDGMEVCASYGMQDEAQFSQILNDAMVLTAGGGTRYANHQVIFRSLKKQHQHTPLWINGEKPWDNTPNQKDKPSIAITG